MLLGMALYKSGFLEGRWSSSAYAKVAVVCLPLGLLLAAYGVVEARTNPLCDAAADAR